MFYDCVNNLIFLYKMYKIKMHNTTSDFCLVSILLCIKL